MSLIKKLANKETVLYLIFGVLATVLNIVLFYLFINIWKMSTGLGNILDTIICILFQYSILQHNRKRTLLWWVF